MTNKRSPPTLDGGEDPNPSVNTSRISGGKVAAGHPAVETKGERHELVFLHEWETHGLFKKWPPNFGLPRALLPKDRLTRFPRPLEMERAMQEDFFVGCRPCGRHA